MGRGNYNDVLGCDDGLGDGVCDGGRSGTDKCGADGDVVGLVECINVGYVEGLVGGKHVDDMVVMIMVIYMD